MNARLVASNVLAFFLACSLIHGCKTDEDAGASALGEDVGPNACTLMDATLPVLGPMEFQRSKGKPITKSTSFDVPLKGDICVLVTNGLHDPPHGQRVSAAWINIDGNIVIGPDSFSQVTEGVQAPYPVMPGEHELSVRLASKPGSYLTVELRFLPEDKEPPLLSIEPANGSTIATDLPLLKAGYVDEGVGVNIETLSVLLDGAEVTHLFQPTESEAKWQVAIDRYLDEGQHELFATIADRVGNYATASSVFLVRTPTSVLLIDLSSDDWLYRRRSAYKLLYRTGEIPRYILRKCLRQLNDTPEPKAVDRLVEMLQAGSSDHMARALCAGALGEAARADPAQGARADVVDVLGETLLSDTSITAKAIAARALGLTLNEEALIYLDEFIESGPRNPAMPADCGLIENQNKCWYVGAHKVVSGFQVVKSAIRIAGHGHSVDNPGNIMEVWKEYMVKLKDFLEGSSGDGGAP